MTADKLDGSALRSGLKTRVVGSRIIALDSVESTNDRAWIEALEGAPEGTVLFAEEQTRGRGRFGRVWVSPRGANLLFSVILRPKLRLEEMPYVTAIGALAVVDAAFEFDVRAQIQFPNDVMVEGRKLCGILVEARFISGRPDTFVLGIGINANIPAFPDELRDTATSFRILRKAPVNRGLLARSVLQALDHWYAANPKAIHRAWKEHSYILDRHVEAKEAGKHYRGLVVEVDVLDGLTLRLDNGHLRQVRGEHVERLRVVS